MNSTIRPSLFSVFLLCAGLILYVDSAHAITMATSQATLDSIEFNVNGVSPFEVRAQTSFLLIDADETIFEAPFTVGPPFPNFAVARAIPHADGVATATSTPTIFSRAAARADSSSPRGNFARANMGINNTFTGLFTALEPTTVSIRGNFRFEHLLDVDTPLGLTETTSVASIFLRKFPFGAPGPFITVTDEQTFENSLSSPGSLSSVRKGEVFASLNFNPGEIGLIKFDVGNTASAEIVPEPSTFLLLGSGIAGLAAWRWKNAKGSKS